MGKWLAGVGAAVLSGVLIWLITKPPSGPPQSQSPPSSLTGAWKYKMTSSVSGRTYEGSMHLAQDGDIVTGEMDDPEGAVGGRTSGVKGTYVRGDLELSRGTGLSTNQEYRLTGTGDQLRGTFQNTGKFPDSGTMEIKRGSI